MWHWHLWSILVIVRHKNKKYTSFDKLLQKNFTSKSNHRGIPHKIISFFNSIFIKGFQRACSISGTVFRERICDFKFEWLNTYYYYVGLIG